MVPSSMVKTLSLNKGREIKIWFKLCSLPYSPQESAKQWTNYNWTEWRLLCETNIGMPTF